MLPTRIALVPYDANSRPEPEELLRVTAALQTQVERDLRPVWGVSAIVSAFMELEHVPPGYLPLVIADAELPFDYHGLHFTGDGQPLALIAYNDSWSLTASHELLEMLVDPYGVRIASGPSLADDQGDVEYLVEVCDPCQQASYTIDGVLVSDFVTPRFFDPAGGDGTRYSYTGAVDGPRRLLQGGYISWRVRSFPVDSLYQAFGKDRSGTPEVRAVDDPSARLSRDWVDRHHAQGVPHPPRDLPAGKPPLAPARERYKLTTSAAQRYGAILRAEIKSLLPPPPQQAAIEALLKDLATDNKARTAFRKDPGSALKALDLEVPAGLGQLADLPKKKDYQALLDMLQAGGRFGAPASDQPGFAAFLCSLGGF